MMRNWRSTKRRPKAVTVEPASKMSVSPSETRARAARADSLLLRAVDREPLVQGGLGRSSGEDGAAIGPAHGLGVREMLEVPPDGRGRNAEKP